MSDGGWREENMDLHEDIRELEEENERLRKVERRFSDELGFTDFAEGIGPVYATADQMIEQIRREREQSEEYWAENERLRKVVDGYRGIIAWLSGSRPDFPEPIPGRGNYWWRVELRKRVRELEENNV